MVNGFCANDDGGKVTGKKKRIRVVFGVLCGGLKLPPQKVENGDRDNVGGGLHGDKRLMA